MKKLTQIFSEDFWEYLTFGRWISVTLILTFLILGLLIWATSAQGRVDQRVVIEDSMTNNQTDPNNL